MCWPSSSSSSAGAWASASLPSSFTTQPASCSAATNPRRKCSRRCKLSICAACKAVSWRLSEKAISLRRRADHRAKGEELVELPRAAVIGDAAGGAEEKRHRHDSDAPLLLAVAHAVEPVVRRAIAGDCWH